MDIERLPKLLFRKWWDSTPVMLLFLGVFVPLIIWREILLEAWQGLRGGGEKI